MSIIRLRAVAYLELATANGHLTYEQQAVAAGLGAGTIHRLRNGGPASSTAVAAICNAYGVEFADVFEIAAVEVAPEGETNKAAA
ncbi:helix-turn-helix domain-containing protein [Streptomyces violarus]|uniref:helix-turn-helix domain-containing protein n=1 Tax=Streptomyces violarus TaxID=67380 RepID=UPI0021BE525A|nr:helix-turn-helix transcriptional regulator [Streptomyces violarus]MCT9139031.1 helix-turn-helix transcriptional regulator [Streptomyces violarus]